MKRWLVLGASVLFLWSAAIGCSGGSLDNGTNPDNKVTANDLTFNNGSLQHPEGSVTGNIPGKPGTQEPIVLPGQLPGGSDSGKVDGDKGEKLPPDKGQPDGSDDKNKVGPLAIIFEGALTGVVGQPYAATFTVTGGSGKWDMTTSDLEETPLCDFGQKGFKTNFSEDSKTITVSGKATNPCTLTLQVKIADQVTAKTAENKAVLHFSAVTPVDAQGIVPDGTKDEFSIEVYNFIGGAEASEWEKIDVKDGLVKNPVNVMTGEPTQSLTFVLYSKNLKASDYKWSLEYIKLLSGSYKGNFNLKRGVIENLNEHKDVWYLPGPLGNASFRATVRVVGPSGIPKTITFNQINFLQPPPPSSPAPVLPKPVPFITQDEVKCEIDHAYISISIENDDCNTCSFNIGLIGPQDTYLTNPWGSEYLNYLGTRVFKETFDYSFYGKKPPEKCNLVKAYIRFYVPPFTTMQYKANYLLLYSADNKLVATLKSNALPQGTIDKTGDLGTTLYFSYPDQFDLAGSGYKPQAK